MLFKRCAAALLLSLGFLYSTAAFCLSPLWDDWLQTVRSDLGYSVVQGGAHVFELSDCAIENQTFGSCGGNNPAAPYIEIQPPVSNGTESEFVDPCYTIGGRGCNNFSTGDTGNAFTAAGPTGSYVNQYYRLGNEDAIVTIVSLPPRAAYLGYQSYVFSRAVNQYSPLPIVCVPAGGLDLCRSPVLASIGNSINNAVLRRQSSTLALPAPGATIAPEVVFISTANRTLYEKLRKAFLSNGGSSTQIFVEPFYRSNEYSAKPPLILGAPYSSKNVITGFDTSDMSVSQVMSDEFNTLMRYAAFEDATASRRWLCAINQDSGNLSSDCQNLAPLPPSPISVYRITKKQSKLDWTYVDKCELINRGINHDETKLHFVDYGTAASDLANAISDYMKKKHPSDAQMGIKHARSAGNVGPYCLTYGLPCFEDTQDTAPYGTLNGGQLSDNAGNIAFMVGVNHTRPGVNNATYLSVGVYDAGSLQLQTFDIGLLEGIASLTQTNAEAAGFDSCATPSTDMTRSNCLNGSALQVWKDIGQPAGDHLSLNATTVTNLYVATIARDTYCATDGEGATLPFCSSTYIDAGYTILPITPPPGVNNTNCDAVNDAKCGKYLPLNDIVGFSERAYVVPGLTNGADPDKIVYPYLVH
jgi:hypothetical protein